MFKKLLSVLLAVCLLVGVFPLAPTLTANALSTSSDANILSRIDSLYGLVGGKYFNVDQNTACGTKSGGHSCNQCFTNNIVKAGWFKNIFGNVSTNQFPKSYGTGTMTYSRAGYSCLGFANFAEWYIFKSSNGSTVNTNRIGTYDFNYSNVSTYAMVGDIFRLNNSHSVIFISADTNGIYVLDSNWSGSYNCFVSKHTIGYNRYNTFTIARATDRSGGGIDPDPGHPTLRSGSTGSEVSLLQSLLNSVQNAGLTVDGKYGPATVAAVKKFQQSRGLTVDGVCGPSTWSALESAKPVGTTSKPSVSVNGQNVTVSWTYSGGGTSIDVYLIQSPWGWNDIKHKQAVSPNSTSCTFTNVAPGYYRAFTIARPNSDTAQSEWAEFSVSEPHTTHTKGSFVRTGTEHPHYNYYSCTVCGQEFTDGSVTPDNYCTQCHWEHIWDSGKITKEPTFTENGIRTYTCTICGSMKEESISSTTSIVIPFPDYEPHLQGMYTITSDGSLRVSKDSNFFIPLYENLVKSDVYKQYRSSITKLIFEEGVTSIGDGFLGSNSQYALDNVTSIELPSSLKKLEMGAFRFCPSVERIYIPESVSEIEYRAFSYCKSLKQIEVSENNPWFKSADGIVYTKDMSKLIAFPEGWSGDYTPPAQLQSVDRLINCSQVNSVVIPNGQTQIFSNTFIGCENLRNVTIPKTVNKIHYSSFAGCSSLTDIYYEGTADDWNKIEITKKGEYDTGEDATGIILSATKHFSSPSTPTPPPITSDTDFSDVSAGAYYAEPVVWAVENGITSGTGNNRFSPNASCTREQIVTFLWRAAGEPEPQTSISLFSDVKPTDYFYKAVLWAVENNITSGEGKGKFGSGNPCSRGQAMTFLWRAAKEPEAAATSSFTDVKNGSYYEKAVNWAVANKITSGTGATTFGPDQSCTRGQIVTFLYRADS